MAKHVEIPKYDDDKSWEENSPSWMPSKDKEGTPAKPNILCKCGRMLGIGLHHVHPDGRVTASLFHSSADMPNGCDWHVFVKLKDWTGHEFKPEKE